jgi:hypothetical protein
VVNKIGVITESQLMDMVKEVLWNTLYYILWMDVHTVKI